MPINIPDLLSPIRLLHEKIRAAVVDATERASLEAMSEIAEEEEGDTIYAVDKVSEEVLIEFFEKVGASIGVSLSRKKAREALVKSEERFRKLFERHAAVKILLDPDTGNITHLVMREGHLWGQKDVSIPISAVRETRDKTVFLTLNKQQIESLPTIPIHRPVF